MAFNEKKAERVIRFIECLKHTKGEFHGKPFLLLPWQKKIVADVFGTMRDDYPDQRQYNTAYIEIPKKNGKSELGAALALNMLANDDEWKAEVYSCASYRQQAAIVFDVAVGMVKQSPALSKRIKLIPSMKRMVYQPTGSIYQVLSSEVATKHGLNVSACIFDFHEAVDDYLNLCAEEGKTPEKAYKGSFNIRISPELHRRAAIYATTHQTTLNHVVENALEHYVPAY